MRQMRKINRQTTISRAYEIFDKAPFVTVSMVHTDGTPYAVPLSVVRADESTFYFHCAAEGEKIDCLKANPEVSLVAVSRCTPKYEAEKNNFTEYYDSAMACGKAVVVTDREEKIKALELLCRRFLPKFMEHFQDAIARSLDITTVYRITLTVPITGKSKP